MNLPPLQEPGEPEIELIEIWQAADETQAQIIRGALEAAGITCMFRGESLRLTHGITVDGLAEVSILVRPEHADEARSVIAQADAESPPST